MHLRAPLLLVLVSLASPAFAGIRYVNAALNTGANNGTSWADAFQGSNGLQMALGVVVPGDQIWVAQGRYKPSPNGVRAVSFVLRDGVEIYGGFDGTESSLGQRDFLAHVTALTGDLNGDDGSNQFADNSFHVVDGSYNNATAILDGCTVRAGNANGTAGVDVALGGGILCHHGPGPTLRHCILRENRCSYDGGGGYVNDSNPTFVDCRFESNVSPGHGGGVFVGTFQSDGSDPSPTFLRCVFTHNRGAQGGGIQFMNNSHATLINCVFSGNRATDWDGGAIHVSDSQPVIRNCTIVGNRSNTYSGAGILATSPITLANNILYSNLGPTGQQGLLYNVDGGNCTYCCVQFIGPGSGNISADPLFLDPAAGNLRLQATSPCADSGNNSQLPTGITVDLDGNPRVADDPFVPDTGLGSAPIVDIGAYELPSALYIPFCAGDGSLGTACPCGNSGAVGRGCLNSDSLSLGALLVASGPASPDAVVLSANGMLSTSTCIFLQGDLQSPGGTVFGDGVRCVAGSLKRLYLKSATGGVASAPEAGDLPITARSAQLGDPISPGMRRYYQVYYHDSNLLFCPAPQGNSWNVSSGQVVSW